VDFTDFVLSHLPPAPARVLDVGCGDLGGSVPALAIAGYDAFGVDPRAPAGPRYGHGDYRDVEETFDAVVAGRILHHIHPLGDGLDKLAALAPLLIVDEFAGDLIDDAGQDWYENQYRMLVAAGPPPNAPASIDVWRSKHPDLHPHGVVLDGLRVRYEEQTLEWRPYYYRWLRGPSSEALETSLIAAGAFPAIGWRWVGVRKG
jgi:hypothetical protein